MKESSKRLTGKLVLMIQDDGVLADYIGAALCDAGAYIIGPARTVAEARALLPRLRNKPVAVVVSTKLFAADDGALRNGIGRLAIPVLIIGDGNGRPLLPLPRHDVLTVPFASHQIVDRICSLVGAVTIAQLRARTGPVLQGH
ncbi:hypothetical protein [Sphingomonas faeni]|uniref:hypothetical protein n=1 Tax=Sphingomonas faeni TaxID=185950 RepID=UPI0027855193|nr:hypothetical protein [Sphingomonas faeni]MDQ0840261.1 hypothetical protein [Sphingomonas faeni]